MDDQGVAKVSDDVRASFEPIMTALGPECQELASVQDVVTTRRDTNIRARESRSRRSSTR